MCAGAEGYLIRVFRVTSSACRNSPGTPRATSYAYGKRVTGANMADNTAAIPAPRHPTPRLRSSRERWRRMTRQPRWSRIPRRHGRETGGAMTS